ncbi:hypothetical protein NED98_07965 [Sphingomonas sp. MMSM20]|uniref:hypothetical protein n=1 Tax=Sphingomonas lycopersici TaxID=2951807 RepID=UPI00223913B2|nr:hypothetical protein [Sphingomonas lycopersici]MCW6530179.1 hypothetical protein [Sphingomonas lycopersici]
MSKFAKNPKRPSMANGHRISFAAFVAAATLAFIVLAVQHRIDDIWWILNGLLQPAD